MARSISRTLFHIFLLSNIFGKFISADLVSFPSTTFSMNQTGSSYSWFIYTPSNNCGTGSSIAEVYPPDSATNTLYLFGWDGSVLNGYPQINGLTLTLTTYEYPDSSFYKDPSITLMDTCGNNITVPPVLNRNYPSSDHVQRSYNYTFLPSKLSADLFKNNFQVSIQAFRSEVSPGASGTFAPKCIAITFDADAAGMLLTRIDNKLQASPSSNPCNATTPSPSSSPQMPWNSSPSPSASPVASSSVGATPSSSPSRSPFTSATTAVSPSPSPSHHASPQKSKGSGGSNSGTVIGAVVGSIVGIAIIGALAFLLVAMRRKNRKESPHVHDLEEDKGAGPAVVALKPAINDDTQSVPAPSPARTSKLTTELYIDEVQLKGLLGKGKFGEVYEGLWHGTTAVACKKLKKEDREEFENEIMLLMKLNHPNVVRCLGIYSQASTGELFMILELLRLGSLSNFLRTPEAQKKLAVADLIEMCVNAASGMVFLEQKNIVHRDLGARNLLVTESDGRYVVKISDFGLSRQVEENESVYSSKVGVFPVKWSPPEVINYRQFTSKSDVWSFGITMWEIFELGKVPYPTLSNDETVAQVMKGYRLPCPSTCPETIYKIMLKCWSQDPNDRPNFKTLHDQLLQALKSIKTEEDESHYTQTEDPNANYNGAYNTGAQQEMYNNNMPKSDMYNT